MFPVEHQARAVRLLLDVAQERFVESEYAGQTREFCAYCGQERDYFRKPDADLLTSAHEDHCPTREARQVLGETFVAAHQAEQDAERAAREKAEAQERKRQQDAARHKQRQLENDQRQRDLSAQKRAQKKIDRQVSLMAGNLVSLEKQLQRR